MKRQKLKKNYNNKGYTMVTTMIVIAFVTVLAVIVLSASTMNLKLNYIDNKVKMDFYTVESAMDEISSGIGLFASETFGKIYTKILSESTGASEALYQTQEEAYEAFRIEYFKALDLLFMGMGGGVPRESDGTSQVAATTVPVLFEEYVLENLVSPNAVTVNINSIRIIREYKDAKPNKYVFQDISVTYLDGEGNESSVTSDIVLEIPYVNFFNQHDNLLDYAIVANDGIFMSGTGIEIEGNVYGGVKGVDKSTDKDPDNSYGEKDVFGGINIGGNSDVKIKGKYVISEANITVRDSSSLSIEGIGTTTDPANIWAESIKTVHEDNETTNRAKISIRGNTFLSNDLELNSKNSEVTLEGSFYGYNNKTFETKEFHSESLSNQGTNHAKSSAIIINSKDSMLNLSGLDTLVVAGKAYVDLGAKADTNAQKEYATGESLALKSNQSMYLVPAEYLNYTNPVNEINVVGTTEIDVAAAALINPNPLTNWFGILEGYVNSATPIIAKEVIREGQNYYYFYWNFEDTPTMDGTSKFANEVLGSNDIDADLTNIQAYAIKKKLQERLFLDVINTIELSNPATTRIYGLGALQETTIVADPLNSTIDHVDSNIASGGYSLDIVTSATTNFNVRYQRLCDLLESNEEISLTGTVPPIDPDEYKAKYQVGGADYIANISPHLEELPLSNYVNVNELTNITRNLNEEGATDNQAVIAKTDITIKNDYKGIIICDGNVTIEANKKVEGIILATGKVYLKAGANVISDRGITQALLNEQLQEPDPKSNHDNISYYFVDYMPTDASLANNHNTSTNYLDWMSYQNWRKGNH